MRADEAPGAGLCPATMRVRGRGGRLDHDDGQDAWAAVPNLIRVRWRAQLRRAAMLLGGIAVPFGWLLALPAAGAPTAPDSSAQTVTLTDAAEAWYAPGPVDVCTTPLGCPPDQAPTSPYPADTLHVGLAGGQETARSYLLPELALVPPGATILSATMTLPVAAGATDGTQSPDAAHVVACLATQAFADGQQGSGQTPPKADCSTTATASYDAKKSRLTLDLTTFVAAWSRGAVPFGIALLPDAKSAQPTDAWHVTIDGHKRQGTPHVETVVTFTSSGDVENPYAALGVSGGSVSGASSAGAPPPTVPDTSLPAPSTQVPPAQPPVVAGQQPVTTAAQQPAAYARGVPPPLAFIAPLLLLAGAVFFARVFTRDATPRTVQA
jgi:hypothetical protein